MTAEILCVGTELLLGNTVNTNATYISSKLSEMGINVFHQSVVGDNSSRLEEAIISAIKKCDILITTGGLGPTYDDITKETVAKAFNKSLYMNNDILNNIKNFFYKINKPMPENNKKQAMIPNGAIILENTCGTAPGIILEDSSQGKIAILLPGPPNEMKVMFKNSVIPYLVKLSNNVLVSKNIHLFGIGESDLEQQLHTLMKKSKNPTIAPYAKTGEVVLRVTACAENKQATDKIIKPVVDKICNKFNSYVYGIDIENIETALINELKNKNLKIAVAESCTGGLISKRITDIAGASQVFDCGICSYSDDIKQNVLKVNPLTLNKFSAVSENVAIEMAKGVRNLANADIAISTTGVAGPGDLAKDKPEGLVYIGIDTDKSSYALKLNLSRGYDNQRDLIRTLAASHALFSALLEIKTL